MEEVRRCDDMAASLIREHNTILWTAQGRMYSYLSACFVVMKVHQRHGIPWFLATLPPVLRVHKRSGESNTKVNIVGAARPLKINKQ